MVFDCPFCTCSKESLCSLHLTTGLVITDKAVQLKHINTISAWNAFYRFTKQTLQQFTVFGFLICGMVLTKALTS